VVKPTPPPDPLPPDALPGLLQRAERGDATTLPALRQLLADPAAVEQLGGNLARRAERLILQRVAGSNLAAQEAAVRKLELLRAELAGPDATPVEALLVERVAACWLQVQALDLYIAQKETELLFPNADYCQTQRERAHQRFLSALKALALVRRLARPLLQINVARQQVNVATAGCEPGRGKTAEVTEARELRE
jgi:hypothetical protein